MGIKTGENMITKDRKAALTTQFGKSSTDTGSTLVQVAILTERIKNLTGHFKDHKLDHHSKRGLMKLIGKRRSLLKYVNKKSPEDYSKIIKELGLRK